MLQYNEKQKILQNFPQIELSYEKTLHKKVHSSNIYLTIPKRKKSTVRAEIEYNKPIKAPIAKGDKLGVLNIYISGELKHEIDFYSSENIKRANIFSRLLKSFGFLVWGDV